MAHKTKSVSASPARKAAVLIQVDVPETSDVESGLKQVRDSLKRAGVSVDITYRPVRIGLRSSRRYVLRGAASASTIQEVTKKLPVTIFPDLEVDQSNAT